MAGLRLDPKDFKHVKSDDKSTTLQHKKGHTLTIQHNILSPRDKTMLQALSKVGPEHMTSTQSQEQQDQNQYGKVIQKAEGGTVPTMYAQGGTPNKKVFGVEVQGTGTASPKPETQQSSGSASDSDAPWPSPSQTSVGKEVAAGHASGQYQDTPQEARGGYIKSGVHNSYNVDSAEDRNNGASLAGHLAREKTTESNQNAKAEHIRVRSEQSNIKPNIKGLANGGEICYACGGPAHRKMYAEGDYVGPDLSNVDPNNPPPVSGMQLPGNQQFQAPDPEKQVISGAMAPAKDWAMAPAGTPMAQPQPGPADVAAAKANANVDSLKGQEEQAQQTADAADQNAAASSNGVPSYGKLVGQGLGQETQGTKELGAAEGAKGAAQAQVLEHGAAQQQDIMNHYQESLNRLTNERQGFIQDIQNGMVDPEKYWKGDAQGNGSHSKIAAGIGMILGGFNPTSNPNAAINFLTHQMDMNLDAQKTNLGAKQNLLSANIAQFKNINEATSMTRLMQADMITTQLNKAAATAATPIAAAQAKMAAGQIAAKYAPLAMNLQIMGMMNGLGQGKTQVAGSTGAALSALDRLSPDAAKNYRERYYQPFDVPGGKSIADRPIPGDVRSTLNAQDILDQKGEDILGFIKQNSGTWNIQKRVVAQQKVEEMKNFYNDSIHGGALTEGRLGWYDEQFKKHPTDILAQFMGNTAKLNEMVNSNRARKNVTLKSYGLTPPPSKQQSQHPMEGKTASDGRGNKMQMINGKRTPVGR